MARSGDGKDVMVEPGRDVGLGACDGPPGPVAPERPAGPALPNPLTPLTQPPPTLADRLLDGAGTGVVAHDHQGVVRLVNAAARRLLPDVRVGEVLGGALDPGSADRGPVTELVAGDRLLRARHHPLPDGWAAWYVDDVTEQHGRVDSLLAERTRSRFLASASRRLGLSLHPGRTARAVVELAAAQLAHAVAVVWPAGGGAFEWATGTHAGPVRSGRATVRDLPAPVVAALNGQERDAPVLLDHLARAPWAADGVGAPGAAAAVVTLPGNGVPAGALVLVRDVAADLPGATASADDAALVEEFAQRAGIAMAAAALYARQARTSGVLRGSLVQPPLPDVAGLALGAAYRPAEESLLIGGDFYGVLPGAGAATTFLLGDVCGKGVDAAVSTGQVRQTLLALRRLEDDPVRLLELLNATMLESAPPDEVPRFVTLVLGAATPLPGGGVRLLLAGGGHLPPLLVRRGGVEPVDIGGMLVGAVPAARFRACTVDLAPGESCVLYTDGVTEAQGGVDGRQVFGEDRLATLLAGCDVLPAPGIADRVAEHATRWLATGYHDDIAVLVVQAPRSVRRAGGRHLRAVREDLT